MELEQRVKALEYEMKILKNEVQKTLLDIQEQILVHYYPDLRTQEASSSQLNTLPTPELPLAEVVTAKDPTLPIVKKISLNEIESTIMKESPSSEAADPAIMGKLLDWVLNTTGLIGTDRTTQMIEIYNRTGAIGQEVKDLMLRIASLNRRAAPDQITTLDVVRAVLKLDGLLGRDADTERALAVVEEANLG